MISLVETGRIHHKKIQSTSTWINQVCQGRLTLASVRGKSQLTILLELSNSLNKHMDKEDPVNLVYLDFQKASDMVLQKRDRKKPSCLGIKGKVLPWVENWPKNRKQRLALNGHFSE